MDEDLPYHILKALGTTGHWGEPNVPRVVEPILGHEDGRVIFPPYETEASHITVSINNIVSAAQFEEMLGEADDPDFPGEPFASTMLDKPVQADPNSCIYVNEGTGKIEYITLTDALYRMIAFCDQHREAGDDLYRQGRKEDARDEFYLTVSASHEPTDYARALLVEELPGMTKELRKAIESLGSDPDELVEMVRKELEGE